MYYFLRDCGVFTEQERGNGISLADVGKLSSLEDESRPPLRKGESDFELTPWTHGGWERPPMASNTQATLN